MNTSKQVNVIVGLLFVGALATLLYFVWDTSRENDAQARQLQDNIERGASLFALNCRLCHGLTGTGALERTGLPGAVLNDESRRSTTLGEVAANHTRFLDTIHCGRVGTLMPAWSQSEGGSLNDFQIQQLVALITGVMPAQGGSLSQDDIPTDPNAVSDAGWKRSLEIANYGDAHNPGDQFKPPKELTKAVAESDTTLTLNDATGMHPDDLLRLDDNPTDGVYEVVKVVDAPAGSALAHDASADDTKLSIQAASVFRAGDKLIVDDEVVVVIHSPTVTQLTSDIGAGDTTLAVKDAAGFVADEVITVDKEKTKVVSVVGSSLTVQRGVNDSEATEHKANAKVIEATNQITVQRGAEATQAQEHRSKAAINELGDTITVERGTIGTKAAKHGEAAHVFVGPAVPPTGPLTGEKPPVPCGQLQAAAASTTPAASPVLVSGSVAMSIGDNFFDLNGQKNPTLSLKVGDSITVQLSNKGSNTHDLRIAGADNEFNTGDDTVSAPDAIAGGKGGALFFTPTQAGTFKYQCDFHPTQMLGEITVTQ